MLLPDETYHDLASLIRAKARRNGAKIAVRFGRREISYARLDELTDRVAGGLAQAGLGRGDRVAAMLFNSPEFIELWFALAKLGAVFVPLNTALKGEILRYELDDSKPKAIVVDTRLESSFGPLRHGLGIPKEWAVEVDSARAERGTSEGDPFRDLETASLIDDRFSPGWGDPAAILYTSGTTGPPKGAIIPHEKYLATPREIGLRSRLEPSSVLFTALPLFHCNAQEMTTITALMNDLTAAFDERFHASTYWETAAEAGATHVSLLISMINVLFKQPERPSDRGHGVRTALTAGASAQVWPEFERRFGVSIIELYGMTECGCTTIMNSPDSVKVGSIGTPLGFVEAMVVDDDDRPVADGTVGELVVRHRTPFTMFLGYLNKPEKTVEASRNLWFHTGDFVRRSGDGYYYFVERKKDIIRRRGENLAPYDVESQLNRHPAVFDCVVVGVASPLGEEDVKAFVQLKPGESVTPEELFRFAAEHLPFFMVPRYLEFIQEIPKTANQKAQRFVLRQRSGGQQYDRESLGIKVAKP